MSLLFIVVDVVVDCFVFDDVELELIDVYWCVVNYLFVG